MGFIVKSLKHILPLRFAFKAKLNAPPGKLCWWRCLPFSTRNGKAQPRQHRHQQRKRKINVMTKQEYLKTGKTFIRKIIKKRKWLQKFNHGYIPEQYSQEIPNIENALSKISQAEKLHNYLQLKESAIRYIIPINMKKWHLEFNSLLNPSN